MRPTSSASSTNDVGTEQAHDVMRPAHERLDPDHPTVDQRHHRLVVQGELLGDRPRDAARPRDATERVERRPHLVVEAHPAVPARGLGPVEGCVGLAEDAVDAWCPGRLMLMPMLTLVCSSVPATGIGLDHRRQQPVGRGDGLVRVHRSPQQHGELVAAESAHHVVGAHGMADPCGDGGQQLVARRDDPSRR